MAHHADVLTKNDTTHARLDSIQRLVSTDSVTVRTTMTRLLRLMNDAALDYSSLIDVQPNILTPPPAQFDVWTPQAPGTTGYWQLYTWPVWGTIEPSRLCP